MKSISFAKLITLGCFALMLPVACGDDDDDTPGPSKGGSGGGAGEAAGGGDEGGAPPATVIPGTSTTSKTADCSTACASTKTNISLYIDPCCVDPDGVNACGVDSGFLTILGTDLKGACLPKNQPGELDAACPTSPARPVTVNSTTVEVAGFPGCCLPTGVCGFQVNEITAAGIGSITKPNLGCVSGAAFGVANLPTCGAGGGGAGGASGGGAGGAAAGDGGAPVVVGGGGAGGAP